MLTPASHYGECAGGTGSYGEVDYEGLASPEAGDPLVYTPAVTRLLSFSCAGSPMGSVRTTLGYGSPFRVRQHAASTQARRAQLMIIVRLTQPAWLLQALEMMNTVVRRSRRLAGRAPAAVAGGREYITRGSLARQHAQS